MRNLRLVLIPLLLTACYAKTIGSQKWPSDNGVEFHPPADNSKWQVVEDAKTLVHYVRISPDEYGPDHTVYATISMTPKDPSAASPEALSNLSKSIYSEMAANHATKLHVMKTTELSKGKCFIYSYTAEDPHPVTTPAMKKNVSYIIETTEYDCIHPYIDIQTMVVLTFSERYAKGDKPAGLDAEKDAFFKKFKFTME